MNNRLNSQSFSVYRYRNQQSTQREIKTQNPFVNNHLQPLSDRFEAKNTSLLPAISFGMRNPKVIESKINIIIDKYSAGEKPLILSVKKDFISRLAKRVTSNDKPLIIGVTGESGSGKSTFLTKIEESLSESESKTPIYSVIKGDNYYKDTFELQKKLGGFQQMLDSGYSLDVPDAVNLDLLNADLKKISNGSSIMMPTYNFTTSKSTPNSQVVNPSKIVLVDSIFALNKKIRNMLDVGVYVDCDSNVMKNRWFIRTAERGKVGEDAERQFADVISKAQQHIIPTKNDADIVLNGEFKFEDAKAFTNDLFQLYKNNKSNYSLVD